MDPDMDSHPSPPTTPAFAAAHETFVRSLLTDPSEALRNYVFGSAYVPFDAPSPTYRAPGKQVSVAIEIFGNELVILDTTQKVETDTWM
jgi:hypothetical protein